MARTHTKVSQAKNQQAAPQPAAVAPPPGLGPPGLAPSASSRKRAQKAAKRQAELDLAAIGCPPGLTPPPGLETIAEDALASDSTTAGGDSPRSSPLCVASSAGAAESAPESAPKASPGTHQVLVSGLPNEILSDLMFEAVLQQAQLKGAYESYTTCPGKHSGEAIVNLMTESAAEWCVHHFHDRSWLPDGTLVQAQLLTQSTSAQEPEANEFEFSGWDLSADFSADAAAFQPSHFQQVYGAAAELDFGCEAFLELERPYAGLSLDAPAFVPASAGPGKLSAEAPVFVPGNVTEKSAAHDHKFTNNSDVSTVDGESESDEEKEGGALEAAAC